ncbi:hypothetical protein ACOSP7_027014 [Xanthoceras sorbifolium]
MSQEGQISSSESCPWHNDRGTTFVIVHKVASVKICDEQRQKEEGRVAVSSYQKALTVLVTINRRRLV